MSESTQKYSLKWSKQMKNNQHQRNANLKWKIPNFCILYYQILALKVESKKKSFSYMAVQTWQSEMWLGKYTSKPKENPYSIDSISTSRNLLWGNEQKYMKMYKEFIVYKSKKTNQQYHNKQKQRNKQNIH